LNHLSIRLSTDPGKKKSEELLLPWRFNSPIQRTINVKDNSVQLMFITDRWITQISKSIMQVEFSG
jgi:hypothetical protein